MFLFSSNYELNAWASFGGAMARAANAAWRSVVRTVNPERGSVATGENRKVNNMVPAEVVRVVLGAEHRVASPEAFTAFVGAEALVFSSPEAERSELVKLCKANGVRANARWSAETLRAKLAEKVG